VWDSLVNSLYCLLKLDDMLVGDEDTKDLCNKYIWEPVGVLLGLFLALYHIFIMNCCVNKSGSKE
jgi:hypothetical protein